MFGRLADVTMDQNARFKIAILCALPPEADLVGKVFDCTYGPGDYGRAAGDTNSYTTGCIAGLDVVLVHCPRMGTITAARVAASMKFSFKAIEVMIVAGICGAVPHPRATNGMKSERIWLGDCLISDSIFQIDFGRKSDQGLLLRSSPDDRRGSGYFIDSLVAKLTGRQNRINLARDLKTHLRDLQSHDRDSASYPGGQHDQLYDTQRCKDSDCKNQCRVIETRTDIDYSPRIHFGAFGSSNATLRSAADRDRLAKEYKIIAFEMEAAGVWEEYPTIIIKAACDYADSHKNNKWQDYATAVAAAALKAVLIQAYPTDVTPSSSLSRTSTATTLSLLSEPRTLPPNDDPTMAVSSDLTMLAYGCPQPADEPNAKIRVHGVRTGEPLYDINIQDETQVRSLAFSPNGKLLASSHGAFWCYKKESRFAKSLKKVVSVRNEREGQYKPVRVLIWTLTDEGYGRRTIKPHEDLGTSSMSLDMFMSFNSTGDKLAVVYGSDQNCRQRPSFFIIDVHTGIPAHRSTESLLGPLLVGFSPDSMYAFVHLKNRLLVLDPETHEWTISTIPANSNIVSVFNPHASIFITQQNGDLYIQCPGIKHRLRIDPGFKLESNARTLFRLTTDDEMIFAITNIGSQELCIGSLANGRCKIFRTENPIAQLLGISSDARRVAWFESRSPASPNVVHICVIQKELEEANAQCQLEPVD